MRLDRAHRTKADHSLPNNAILFAQFANSRTERKIELSREVMRIGKSTV